MPSRRMKTKIARKVRKARKGKQGPAGKDLQTVCPLGCQECLKRKRTDQRQSEKECVTKAFTVKCKDGTVRSVPERRRAIGSVSTAEVNRELALLKRMFTLPEVRGRRGWTRR